MIDVKKAAEIAVQYLQSLPNIPAEQIRLEEVALTDNEQFWLITLSFTDTTEPRGLAAMTNTPNRQYKVFKIEADTGGVRSMKIRRLESV